MMYHGIGGGDGVTVGALERQLVALTKRRRVVPLVAAVESLLSSENLTVIRTTDEPPSPAQVAGTDTIQIGGIKQDFANSSGLWFWAVSDNLRLAAINAVAAAENIFLP